MGTNVVVDVVIGLVVLYWLVATFSSFLVEAINSAFNVRGEALLIFVREMLAGDTSPELQAARRKLSWLKGLVVGADRPNVGTATARASLADLDVTLHPLIRRLYKPAGDINKADTAPSYIPAEMFTKALLDRLSQLFAPLLAARDALQAAHDHLPEAYRAALRPQLERGLAVVDAAEAAIDLATQIGNDVQDRDALQKALENAGSASAGPLRVALGVVAAHLAEPQQWQAALNDPQRLRTEIAEALKRNLGSRALTLDDLRHIVQTGKLPDSLAAALRPLIDAANHDMETFRRGLDDWYSSVMDRASGWFKRRAQWMLFLVALGAAAAFNLDTLYIARKLAADVQLREAAVRLGSGIVADPQAASSYSQQLALRVAFADGRWVERLTPGATAPEADPIALRVLALSSRHGSLLAPLLAQQAVALRIDGQQWKATQQGPMLNIAGNLCRARIAATPGRERDRDWASQHKDEALAQDARCKDERELFTTALDDDPRDAFDRLWGSLMISWNPDLAQGAWRVHRLAVAAPAAAGADESKAVQAMADSIRSALAKVERELGDLDSILSRLPDVGSTAKAFNAWSASNAQGSAALWGMLGWLLTGFMASLGAPLWFDLLNRLTSRRISGPKPEPSVASN